MNTIVKHKPYGRALLKCVVRFKECLKTVRSALPPANRYRPNFVPCLEPR